ncbi:MAG: hypothetical protein IJR93_07180 [Treponema sp.]|nr:hypothetical protein [Treponema sp.]MBQ7166707.1 hypothetical protein [Treponema sp.]
MQILGFKIDGIYKAICDVYYIATAFVQVKYGNCSGEPSGVGKVVAEEERLQEGDSI